MSAQAAGSASSPRSQTRGFSPMMRAGAAVIGLSVPAAIAYMLVMLGPILLRSGWRIVAELVSWSWIQILVAYCAMFLFLVATARTAEPGCIRSRLLTALYFLGVYLVGVASGCLANLAVFPAEPPASERFYYLVISPGWVFALFGFLPAFFLGAAGHSILRRFTSTDASGQASHESVSSS